MSGSQRDSESDLMKQTGQLTDFLFHVDHGDGGFYFIFTDRNGARLAPGRMLPRTGVNSAGWRVGGLVGWWSR